MGLTTFVFNDTERNCVAGYHKCGFKCGNVVVGGAKTIKRRAIRVNLYGFVYILIYSLLFIIIYSFLLMY